MIAYAGFNQHTHKNICDKGITNIGEHASDMSISQGEKAVRMNLGSTKIFYSDQIGKLVDGWNKCSINQDDEAQD
jgi:hypothetical protein